MKRGILILLLICVFAFVSRAQNKLPFTTLELAQLKKLKARVEANPADLKAHEAYIQAFSNSGKFDSAYTDTTIEKQYQTWIKQFPKIHIIPFVIGKAYIHAESPKATAFLLRASVLKPNHAETWSLLSLDATFRNDIIARQAYLKKATQYDATNADYAFNYAFSYEDTDPARCDSLSLEVARKFPGSGRGSLALLLLAKYSTIPAEKVAYYKQIYNRKLDQRSDEYLQGLLNYFDYLLKTNPNQAFELGLTMVIEGKINRNLWKDRIKVADTFLKVKKLLAEKNPKEALALLNTVDLLSPMFGSYTIDAEEYLAIYKAEVADAAGQTQLAYDSLAVLYIKEPTEGLHKAVFMYGKKLGMDSTAIASGIGKTREGKARQAIDFTLENYLSPGKTSLSDYRGKVILLTYWFPGCGPCRAEFPYFESVLKKFNHTEVAYLGLNLEPTQDDYVLPFLKQTGYGFTPLHDSAARNKENLPAPGAPANYLIDQKGRIVFSGFRIDKENERTLELMIKETLATKD